MKLRNIGAIDVLIWTIVLCCAAWMIAATVHAIVTGKGL